MLSDEVYELERRLDELEDENYRLKIGNVHLDGLIYNMKLYGVWTQQIEDFINFCKETGKLCQN